MVSVLVLVLSFTFYSLVAFCYQTLRTVKQPQLGAGSEQVFIVAVGLCYTVTLLQAATHVTMVTEMAQSWQSIH